MINVYVSMIEYKQLVHVFSYAKVTVFLVLQPYDLFSDFANKHLFHNKSFAVMKICDR